MARLSVEDAYRNILGREPDQGGLDYWKSQVGDTFDPEELKQLQDFFKGGLKAGPKNEPGLNTDWYQAAWDTLSGNPPEGFRLPQPAGPAPQNYYGDPDSGGAQPAGDPLQTRFLEAASSGQLGTETKRISVLKSSA